MLKVQPSKMDLACSCAASISRCQPFPFEENKFTKRGNELHEIVSMLTDNGMGEFDALTKDLPDADKEAVKTAVGVAKTLEPAGKHYRFIEEKVDVSFIYPPAKKKMSATGKVDLAYFDVETGVLMVCDHKFGSGQVPDPSNNRQLQTYALALRDYLKAEKHEVEQIYLVICQPCGTVKQSYRDAIFKAEVFPQWEKEIKDAVEATQNEEAVATPGEHCKRSFCDAGKHGVCPEFNAFSAGKILEKTEKKQDEAKFAVSGLNSVTVTADLPAVPLVVLSSEAVARANELLAQSKLPVVDQYTAESMARSLTDITKFEKQVDLNRETVKKPFLELGRAIDDAAKQALIPLREAKAQAQQRIQDWKKGEDDKAAKIQAEFDRKKREADEALRQADLKRQQAEKALRDAKGAEERKKALEEAEKAAREQSEALNDQEAVQAPVVQAPVKIAGLKMKLVPEFTILEITKVPAMFLEVKEALLKKAIEAKSVTEKDTWLEIKWVEKASSTGRG